MRRLALVILLLGACSAPAGPPAAPPAPAARGGDGRGFWCGTLEGGGDDRYCRSSQLECQRDFPTSRCVRHSTALCFGCAADACPVTCLATIESCEGARARLAEIRGDVVAECEIKQAGLPFQSAGKGWACLGRGADGAASRCFRSMTECEERRARQASEDLGPCTPRPVADCLAEEMIAPGYPRSSLVRTCMASPDECRAYQAELRARRRPGQRLVWPCAEWD
jgi:hypothetical protein